MEHAKLDASPCGHWLRKSKSKSSGRKRGTILEGREREKEEAASLSSERCANVQIAWFLARL